VKIEGYDIFLRALSSFCLYDLGMRLAKLSELDLFGGLQAHGGAK